MWLGIGLYALTGAVLLSVPVDSRRSGTSTSQVSPALNLLCPPCDRIHCYPRRAKNLKCPGGLSLGVCNCCPVCAKQVGEPCGGENSFMGKCDQGLICEVTSAVKPPSYAATGRCLPDPSRISVLTGEQKDEAWSLTCRPKCTPDYCHQHPKSVCSAVDNNEEKQHCQGECQHTSCRSCHFLPRLPECPKCGKDDFRCMRLFGQCIKQDYCSREKYPCRKTEDDPDTKFQCIVPECPETN